MNFHPCTPIGEEITERLNHPPIENEVDDYSKHAEELEKAGVPFVSSPAGVGDAQTRELWREVQELRNNNGNLLRENDELLNHLGSLRSEIGYLREQIAVVEKENAELRRRFSTADLVAFDQKG